MTNLPPSPPISPTGNPLMPNPGDGESPTTQPFRYIHSPDFPRVLGELGVTLVATTYQAGRVLAFSSNGAKCSLLMRAFGHPMGIAVSYGRMALVCKNQIWFMMNQTDLVAEDGKRPQYESYYIPRRSHVTGDIAGHEIAWGKRGLSPDEEDDDDENNSENQQSNMEAWVVNTRFSCLCTLDPEYSFVPRWHPPFVSKVEAGDRCHLNGLAMRNGYPAFVSAFAETNTSQGWREHREDGGLILDIASGEIITRGLAMPHSPRWYDDKLWILDSGKGEFLQVDPATGGKTTIIQLPGFTRGLAFHDHYAFVGLSKTREKRTFGDLPLENKVNELECAIYMIDLNSGKQVGFVRFEKTCDELFDVQVVPKTRNLNVIGFSKDTVNGIFVLPRNDRSGRAV